MALDETLVRKEFASRERTARIVAAVLVKSYSYELRKEIADKGFDEFYRVAKPQLSHYSFRQDEYQRIFNTIVVSVRPSWKLQSQPS